jgi:predicted small lipoprotein YifL
VFSVAALALGACGRKAGLDLPPNASTASTNVTPPVDTQMEAASKPSLFGSNYGADSMPAAARGTKKSFVLDPLLGN